MTPRSLFKNLDRWKSIIIVVSLVYTIPTIYCNLTENRAYLKIPVYGATSKSWDRSSFWFYPWGDSKIHKGIDIFAAHKTPIYSPINGVVVSAGYSANGGNYIYILDRRFRTYYFAHLNVSTVRVLDFVEEEELIGSVGNTGNAISRPHHLHFSIFSLFPILKGYSKGNPSGWKKMFYLDPNDVFLKN